MIQCMKNTIRKCHNIIVYIAYKWNNQNQNSIPHLFLFPKSVKGNILIYGEEIHVPSLPWIILNHLNALGPFNTILINPRLDKTSFEKMFTQCLLRLESCTLTSFLFPSLQLHVFLYYQVSPKQQMLTLQTQFSAQEI